jgi:hypothetical protein
MIKNMTLQRLIQIVLWIAGMVLLVLALVSHGQWELFIAVALFWGSMACPSFN